MAYIHSVDISGLLHHDLIGSSELWLSAGYKSELGRVPEIFIIIDHDFVTGKHVLAFERSKWPRPADIPKGLVPSYPNTITLSRMSLLPADPNKSPLLLYIAQSRQVVHQKYLRTWRDGVSHLLSVETASVLLTTKPGSTRAASHVEFQNCVMP